ncbi:armadillo-type protein [Zopfochytrium polystomum]|nr:armadillo-type protein [Zopfochytrium polystomum]
MATTLSAAAGAPAPVVPAADLAELDAIVTAVLSPLNDVRQAAEDALLNQWRLVPQRVPLLIAGLAELLRSSPYSLTQTRSMAAVLIRRIGLQAPAKPPNAPVDESLVTVWGLLEQGVRDFVQGCLLQAISQETDQSVRHKICDATALVGVQNSNIGVPWPALLTAVFECVHSPSPQLRDAGLRIISLGAVLFFDLSASAKLVNEIFPANLEFPDSSVKSTAVEACVSFMIAALEERPKAVDQFSGLLQRVLQALVPINDEDVLTNCLSSLTDLASERARIFQKPLLELTQFINSIMKNSELDSTTRQTAAELLVTIANEIPKIVKKKSQFISTLLPTLFDWLATLEDDPDWYTTEDGLILLVQLSQDDEDNGENYVYAEQAIDRLAIALGGETMLPIAFELIPRFIGSADWRQRYAALMAISVLGEGCASLMVERLNDIVKLVLPYLRDSHNRVRYAACNAIGQLCTDFSPTIQNENGQVILASLVPLMDDDSCPRVQAHSAAALVNFLDHADKFKVYPVVGEILPRLVNLLRSNKTYIQEQAVTTIATVADCVQEHFLPYTQSIMPDLVQILQNAMDRKYRLLRGKTLECITLIGLSVKEEGFSPYVEPLLQLLQDIQQSPREDDDPMTSYLLVAWVRMCKIIGAKFVPYLPIVVPPLLAAASVKPEVAIISSEEEFEMYSQEEGWDFIKLGDQRLGIKTALVEDKRTAVEMLCTYAADLEAHFAPYVEKSLAVTLPLVGFVFDLGVRQAAARAAPLLLNCMKQANADMGQILPYWNTVKEKIYERIMMDHDTEYLSDLYISFYLCVRYLGKDFMEADLMEKLVTAAEVNLKQLVSRAYARKANDDEDDLDAEDEELDDENLLIEIANSVHEFFSVGGADFLPYFDKLAPMFKQFLV